MIRRVIACKLVGQKQPEEPDQPPEGPLTERDLAEMTKTGNTIVLFLANWCKPCLDQMAVIERFECAEELTIIQIDTDSDSSAIMTRVHEVASIPTMVFYRDGVAVSKRVGLLDKDQLAQYTSEYFAGA